ncbi:cobalamin B12-binding domain-containing protein [Nonomuraea roseoviolacea]|uniref:Methanogenic corrinoid protein MtbC1 n=1 Tax=Nonomuraea roseoviolacea subsp. carminata TaxID=160689 RepID=A0ABT1K669_9ACTN|nr:cobalamin-dependent protein [Nonomuraea roseoviolacea]MCP2349102.1 methanogenic corrinoid protein MtbC1 [Nonomuraea roseoviolacea subsp. carminata]
MTAHADLPTGPGDVTAGQDGVMAGPGGVTAGDAVSRAELLWDAAAAGDEYAAVDVVVAALDDGMDMESLLMDVVAPVQARVGREWAANRITVAQEHTITAVNERVLAALAHHPSTRAPAPALPAPHSSMPAPHGSTSASRDHSPAQHRGRVTVACIDGEWHAFPARILAEVLRLRGWRVDYLGAQVPTPHLIAHLHRAGPDVVALSSSIATRLPAAHAAITACQATGTPVLAGGAAFGPDGRYARLLGADAWSPDARSAADGLDAGLPPRPAPGRQAVDDLPHLDDQEYTLVARSARQLVRQVMDGLRERVPAMASYSPQQLRHTAEDVSHIVDFLGTALYLDDPELFGGFLAWTGEILAARGVPARVLLPALDLLAERLTDFPRTTGMLAYGHEILRTAAADTGHAQNTDTGTGPAPAAEGAGGGR